MKILFIASFAVISQDPPVSRKLFVDTLGLPLEGKDYIYSEKIEGSKHFGVWPLSEAAEACFGTPDWPKDKPTPQASVEFEVEDAPSVSVAAEELKAKGYELVHEARTEPWGQTVARLLTPEGLIVGISFAPSMHKK